MLRYLWLCSVAKACSSTFTHVTSSQELSGWWREGCVWVIRTISAVCVCVWDGSGEHTCSGLCRPLWGRWKALCPLSLSNELVSNSWGGDRKKRVQVRRVRLQRHLRFGVVAYRHFLRTAARWEELRVKFLSFPLHTRAPLARGLDLATRTDQSNCECCKGNNENTIQLRG